MGNMASDFLENTFVFMMVIGILVMLALALAFVLFFNTAQKKILQEQMRNQKLAYEHQEELLHSTILTQEEERKRIARELHDEIGSKLNVILLNIHRLREPHHQPTEAAEITQEMSTLINTTIDTTRRISHDLLPPTLEDFGLVETIKELQTNFNQSGIITIAFDVVEKKVEIDDKLIELNLFRVLQELINNSIRHGKAAEIGIKLWLSAEQIKLEYTDNGTGFDTSIFAKSKGMGTKNIESRLHMIGASYEYHSSAGQGMKMTLQLKTTSPNNEKLAE